MVEQEDQTSTDTQTEPSFISSDFPNAMPLPKLPDENSVIKLDERLATFDNRHIRKLAVATRDALDICNPGELKQNLSRGWKVLRYEAQRRGLDLDTGRHQPKKATDQSRAKLHQDQEPCSIKLIQQQISRQRTRT